MPDLTFQPLLFGGDINVYSVARAFHEAYGVRSIAYGKYPSFPCRGSAILDYRVCPDNESEEAFRRNVEMVSRQFPDKKVILLGCGDSYVQLAAHCRDSLPENVIAPYIDGALLDTLINKEKFISCATGTASTTRPPLLRQVHGPQLHPPLGPALYRQARRLGGLLGLRGTTPWPRSISARAGKNCLKALDHVYAAGYSDHMVLQEFIPGMTAICGF